MLKLFEVVISGSLEILTSFIIIFSVFRIPYLSYLKGSLILSLGLSALTTLFLDIMHIPFFLNEIVIFVLEVLAFIFWIRISKGYAILLAAFGYLAKEFSLAAVNYICYFLKLMPSVNSAMTDIKYTSMVEYLLFVFVVPLFIYLYHQGIGFMFLNEKLEFKSEFKHLNIAILATIALSFIDLEFVLLFINAKNDPALIYMFISCLIFILAVWIVFVRANRELKKQTDSIDINKLM